MTTDRLRLAQEIYFRVSECPAPERAREASVACGGDTELFEEVRGLLESAERLGSFLDEPPLGEEFLRRATPGALEDDLVGQRIAHYVVQRRIASGGMGTVYEAVREDEFRQRVALKVVKRGMDSEDIVRRFRAERQTLAALNHPNIARLLDGGITPDGRPYLVMEFVEGVPIDTYCNERALSITDRLQLFRRVCDGVSSAHRALVVHRDLKPANILVTPEGAPKLLDFGIAKVLDRSPAQILVTQDQDRRLTPEYASPEQVRGETINTTSDVYSLGVVLFELLTGSRPYQFRTRTMTEIERVICTLPPPPPSTTVSEESSAGAAAVRKSTTQRLRKRLRGDLDTIVLTAMHKDTVRRYASVDALSADIDAYLREMPIAARKDTLAYRAGKFVSRNLLGTILASAAVASLVVGAGLASWQAYSAARERDEAYEARDAAEQIASYLQHALQSADVFEKGMDLRVIEVVDEAAARLEADLTLNPRARAAIQSAIGRVYVGVGEYEKAEANILGAYGLRRQILPDGHHDLAESMMDVALLYHATGRDAEAERELRAALVIHQDLRGEQNLDTARVWNDLGAVLRRQGKFDEAREAHEHALEVRRLLSGDRSLEVAESLNNLSGVFMGQRDFERAEETMTEARDIRRSLLEPDHLLTVQATHNLGTIIANRGDHARAEPLLRESVEGHRRAFPPGHPTIATAIVALGNCLVINGRADEAEPLLREAVEIRHKTLKADDPQVAYAEVSLGRALLKEGNTPEAEEHLWNGLQRVIVPGQPLASRWIDGARDLLGLLQQRGEQERAATIRRALGGESDQTPDK